MKLIKISSNILYVFPFFLLSLVSTACDTNDSGKIMSERETNFNYDWKFIKQNIPAILNMMTPIGELLTFLMIGVLKIYLFKIQIKLDLLIKV